MKNAIVRTHKKMVFCKSSFLIHSTHSVPEMVEKAQLKIYWLSNSKTKKQHFSTIVHGPQNIWTDINVFGNSFFTLQRPSLEAAPIEKFQKTLISDFEWLVLSP